MLAQFDGLEILYDDEDSAAVFTDVMDTLRYMPIGQLISSGFEMMEDCNAQTT